MTKTIKTIYLDHAAATPLDPLVKKAMEPFLKGEYGNPSSLHSLGLRAKQAVDESRNAIAKVLNCSAQNIIFTSGGTESCNLALLGLARKYAEGRNAKVRGHIITSSIEHHAVIEPCRQLEKEGFSLTYLKVDKAGFVNAKQIQNVIRPETILVSVMYANNEIGTVEPIAEIGKLLTRINAEREKRGLGRILFHSDACQAAGFLELNVNRLGLDLMSVNGSKIYGPKQSGFLFVRNGINLKPIIFGGGQERNLRSGTENVANIVGLAKALELTQKNREIENKKISDLRNYFIKRVLKEINHVKLNGSDIKFPIFIRRLPNNINLSIKGVEGEALVIYLDARRICASTGSACSTGNTDFSHVIKSIGIKENKKNGILRLTLGKSTTKKQLDYMLRVLKEVVAMLRGI